MVGATETSKGPEVAPLGMVMLREVVLQELTVTGMPWSSTRLPPCVAPKPVPVIATGLPTAPVVTETPVIMGAGADAELRETLSKVAVAVVELLPLLTASPA